MLKIASRFWAGSAAAIAVGALALAAGSAHAQNFGGNDPFIGGGGNSGFNGNGNGNGNSNLGVRIERFQVAGNGCPDRNSIATFLDQRQNGLNVRVDFNRNGGNGGNGRRFQVNGPGNVAISCTARLQLSLNTNQRIDVSLDRAVEGVRFINRSGQGQLQVRSQFQLNNNVSDVRSFRLQNAANAQDSDVQVNNLGIRARVDRTLNVTAIVQLQLQGGQDNGALRFDDLTMQLRFQNNGNSGNGGFNDGGFGGGFAPNDGGDPFNRF